MNPHFNMLFKSKHAQKDSDWSEFNTLTEAAKSDWQAAINYFQQVTDPDLVDHAIYCLEAAERRYMHLLKQARLQWYGNPKIANP